MRCTPILLLVLALAVAASAADSPASAKVSVLPQFLVNGSVCLFAIPLKDAPDRVNARWLGHDLTFSRGSGSTWYSLAGIAYETKPGTYDVAIDATMPDGRVLHLVKPVTVHGAKYKTSRLTVAQKYVTPDPETLRRIDAEREIKRVAFAHFIPSPEWSGNFLAPVATEITENYGTSRTFNGKLATLHRGTDFRAPLGTPVHASNAGEVVLARDLYYEGNCVVIDHGLGFMTMYMHLSRFDVKEGDKVEKGQAIALTGDTGRVTGPHLHMAVRWSGEYLDPMKLLNLQLPTEP